MSYAVKQIVIQELETARIQRTALATNDSNKNMDNKKSTSTTSNERQKSNKIDDQNVPNHLRQQLNPVQLKPIGNEKVSFLFKFNTNSSK